ncbi:MAG: hypothetical protein AAF567_24400 [Actinomycetota bacterium]
MTSTHELTSALVRYHGSKSRPPIVWEEIEADSSLGRCRFDVLTADVLAGHRLRLRAWEVKVTAQDFWRDVEAEKSRKYLDAGASCVTYVVPRGLVSKSDCPEWAGLMTWNPDTGSFRTTQRAPVEIRPIKPEFMVRLILRSEEKKIRPTETRSERMDRYRADMRMSYWLNIAASRMIENARSAEDRVQWKIENAERAQRQADAMLERARQAGPVASALSDVLRHASTLLSPRQGSLSSEPTRGLDEFLETAALIVPESSHREPWRPTPVAS